MSLRQNNTEVVSREAQGTDAENFRRRQVEFKDSQRTRTLQPFSRVDGLGGLLGIGTYRGGTLSDNARLDGIGWPEIDGQLTIAGRAIVRGVVFLETVALQAAARAQFDGCLFLGTVTIAAGGSGAFSGCTFRQPVTVTATGLGGFAGCRFDGTAAVNNTGLGINCVVAGGCRTSGVAHVGVTSPGGEAV